jgi:chromosome segregation ATPase
MSKSNNSKKLRIPAATLEQQVGLVVAAEKKLHDREKQVAERERNLQSQIVLWELDRPQREAAVMAEEAELLARIVATRQKLDAANEELAMVKAQIGLLKKTEQSAREILGQLIKQLESARNEVRSNHERRVQQVA